jgi:hypothetical protein
MLENKIHNFLIPKNIQYDFYPDDSNLTFIFVFLIIAGIGIFIYLSGGQWKTNKPYKTTYFTYKPSKNKTIIDGVQVSWY